MGKHLVKWLAQEAINVCSTEIKRSGSCSKGREIGQTKDGTAAKATHARALNVQYSKNGESL